jgi:N-acetylated-alpha-linked acidic dipeptidase
MTTLRAAFLFAITLTPTLAYAQQQVFGFENFTQQSKWDAAFLQVPDPTLAGQELKELTKAPHWASSPEDLATANYVAQKFRDAGLDTQIVPYRVLLNKPKHIAITATDANGHILMSGPTPEHVGPDFGGDPFQNDPRILPAFNGSSPSGNVTAPVVYANYGTLADFDRLSSLGIDIRGKIVLVRYGANFRGIKVYIAQQRGALGVLIYSDPADDGYTRGDIYPRGPMRPATGVQRGSVQFLPLYPGDPETPGIASTPSLPDTQRITDPARMNQPSIPSNPLSYADAAPILQALDGPVVPHDWQGALPFTYHLGGTAAVHVHMDLQQDYALRTIWDVIGTIPGTDPTQKDDWVIAGNHRDAWVYGAVDPNSGTAAMLEAVHGLGKLLKLGWQPKRTIVIASWDAEEEGLIGSTEWVEQHAPQLAHAVAYFNTDIGVSGPTFDAAAVPSLKPFLRDITRAVPSPAGGTVYDQWLKAEGSDHTHRSGISDVIALATSAEPSPPTPADQQVHIGDLGSGSDYSPFLQHLGVPSTDIGSNGPYGVYHSAFDNYNWFLKNADPTFVYEQQQARVFGLEVLHMADADILPYDYRVYGHAIESYISAASQRATTLKLSTDFAPATAAAKRFATAGAAMLTKQQSNPSNAVALNTALRNTETALLSEAGLPKRPWYRHTIYAPGEYTGYAAVVIPGVNEALDNKDAPQAQLQLNTLTTALNQAASILETATKN